MTDPNSSGFPLYEILVGDDPNAHQYDFDTKMTLLTKFKGHVKKELLYMPAIRSYFSSLFFVLGSLSETDKLLVLAHSSLCYLVKRVAMQMPSHFENADFIKELLNHLFLLEEVNNDLLQRKNVWTSSSRALEAVYLVQPLLLQRCLKELLSELKHKRKILLVIDEFLQMTKRNSSSMNDDILLMDIFSPECLRKLARSDASGANSKLILEILRKNFQNDDELKNFSQLISEEKSSFKVPIFDVEQELRNIYKDFEPSENSPGRSEEFRDRDFTSADDVSEFLSTLMVPFQSLKETEQNWKARQSNLTQLRDLINENDYVKENPLSFLSACKELQVIECIGKAVVSLRTTLSMTACQLMRTFLQTFNQNIDLAVLDQIFMVLKGLLLTAKKISSNAAFNCLIVLFIHTGFHSKLFQNCLMLINEKSVSARSCSAILLRIILIKYTEHKKLDSSLVYIEEWLKKGITDAQTSVREPMRVTFWYYYKGFPSNARSFLNTQFSSQLKKAIELSVPSHLGIRYSITHSTTSSSLSDSINKSNRHPRRYPSYAKPTQSSNASLLRVSNHRSTSEFLASEVDQNAQLKRKISAPPSSTSLKRPINTMTERKTSNFNSEVESSIQIDLTEDISNGNSNSLITKYLVKEPNSEDLEWMYQSLASSNQAAVKEALQMLQKKLLTDNPEGKQSVDFTRIIPTLRMLIIRAPAELKPFLTISSFCRSIPLNYVIEIHAINFMDFNEQLLNEHLQDNILRTTSSLIMWLHSNAYEKEKFENSAEISLHYMKYKQFIYNVCFRILRSFLQMNAHREPNAQEKEEYSNSMLALSAIWGQEFDERLYFDTIYLFYSHDRELFKQAMNRIDSVSKVVQICDKLAARDGEDDFDYETIIGERVASSRVTGASEEVVEDRRYMEMTMVNPFRPNRSTSAGSVVHHRAEVLGVEDQEAKEAKISEMTKVVSVYEIPSTREKETNIDEDGDLKMSEQEDLNLSDIFTHSADDDHFGVKFSREPPKIINPSTSSSTADTSSGLFKDTTTERHSFGGDISNERDKSPVTPLPDHEAKILSQGINGIDITPKLDDAKNNVSSHEESSKILRKAIKDRSVSLEEKVLLNHISSDTLTYYEICQLSAFTDDAVHGNDRFKQMMQAIARIKRGSFTIRHLTNLAMPLVNFSVSEDLKTWLETDNGYEELLQLAIFLLSSEVEMLSIPMNMACKCILLIECLVLLNGHLDNVAPITSFAFRDIWNRLVELVGKLTDYSNEIYVLLNDLRDLLNDAEFFSATDITTIITFLATQAEESGPRIKETFLIETLSIIIAKNGSVIKKNQFPEIIQMMQYFLNSEFTEWRCASASVLAEVLKHLALTQASEKDLEAVFSSLSEQQFRLIKLLAFR
ncbi:hypothetical protein HG536_0D03620 [Torulaspora globosa]|uniref:Protein STU1 n=1 Tax=Torulaspora globosa TaxID=48254 RepID=A0A7G3ZH54_9SACH|nr:uncharacterized protein HG536_0D03620 [Torulaspora globosa]QLL32840.1 hypothetical protein HG536_0D03620 [Torulaspora globosa]